jgi:hypothetical protein
LAVFLNKIETTPTTKVNIIDISKDTNTAANIEPTVISYKLNKLTKKLIVKNTPKEIPSIFFCNI